MNYKIKRNILFLFLFVCGLLHAQDTATHAKQVLVKDTAKADTTRHYHKPVQSTGYAAFTMAYGYPAGKFAQEGNAEKGSNIGISFAMPIANTGHGVALRFNYGSNPVNPAQFPSDVANQLNYTGSTYTLANTPGNYYYKSLLVGLYVTKPLPSTQNKLSIDYKIMGGFIFATIPQFSLNATDTAKNTTALTDYTGWGSGFAFDLELGVRYLVIPHLSVMLSADYFTAHANYQLIATGQTTDTSGNTTPLPNQVSSAYQNFTLFNINFGVGWTF